MPISLGLGLGITRWPKGGGVIPPEERAPLLTVVCGNSIAAAAKHDGIKYTFRSEHTVANVLCGAPMRFGRMTASTRCDLHGIYGYSGQQLDTITSDMASQWIATINAASVTPELAIGVALVENDIASGISFSTIQSRIQAWVAAVQAAWPGIKIIIATPHPSFTYDSGAKVLVYQQTRDYILSLDNGSTIYASRFDGYEDSGSPGTPLAGYTDASVHPNAKGAMVTARALGETVRRIITPVLAVSGSSITLPGTSSATGTGVSGTKPTSSTIAGSANGTFVSTALQPGWRIVITRTAGGATPGTDLGLANCPADAIAGSPATLSPYLKMRIISGAANIRSLLLEPRILDGGGNTFQYYLGMETADALPGWLDGDVLTFLSPPKAPNSGSITQLINYIRYTMINQDAPATVEVVESGYVLP